MEDASGDLDAFPYKTHGAIKGTPKLRGVACSLFLPLICCIILDKSLILSKSLLFHL